jgi:hypothetical protein
MVLGLKTSRLRQDGKQEHRLAYEPEFHYLRPKK